MTGWQEGRQGTGYRKKLLSHGKRWDLYLLDYPKFSHVPAHVDYIPGRRHVRVNLVLKGERKLYANAILECGPLAIFRSDKLHMVGMVKKPTMVLSLGLSLPR